MEVEAEVNTEEEGVGEEAEEAEGVRQKLTL